jgi:hypothetical protein
MLTQFYICYHKLAIVQNDQHQHTVENASEECSLTSTGVPDKLTASSITFGFYVAHYTQLCRLIVYLS